MTSQSSEIKVASSGRISVAWPPFSEKLAAVLSKLIEDQFLVVSVKGSNRFVQFAAQGAFGMRMETTSNSYLAKRDQLDIRQIGALIELGWQDPTGAPSESTPENDPDGSPNFFCEFQYPASFGSMTALTVRTLTEILRVPHPGFLQYEAFDDDGNALALPELDLRIAKPTSPSDSKTEVTTKLLATFTAMTGISDLAFDDDGDIGIQCGSALTFVRLTDDFTHVRFFSPILREVEASPSLFERLNDINVNESLMHFVFQNGVIYGVAGTPAKPFVSAHIVDTFERFCAVVDGMDSLLQEEFGGRTAFAQSMISTARH